MKFDDFVGESKNDRRLIEYVKTMLQWAEIAQKFDKLFLVQGGFAVDLAAGKITRSHDDLDVLVLADEAGWFKERLPIDGYKLKYSEGKNPEQHFCAYKYNFIIEDSLYIDFGSIHIDKNEVWDDGDEEKYVWPVAPQDLIREVEIDNIAIKFLNPKTVYEFKKKQRENDERREKEEHDFEVLEVAIGAHGAGR